ncbi:MAG: substrate-binding domain-containing protein [Anaerolineae bacterium]
MATIKEVAKLADVSPSTVSNVFTGRVPVREKTRRRVLAAAQTLGYVPNYVARGLRRQETHLVAFSIGDIANPSQSSTVRGASDVLLDHGYHPLIFSCDERPDQEAEILEIARQQRVAGMLLAPVSQDRRTYERLHDLSIKFVCVDRHIKGLDADVVRSDDVFGFCQATQHLLDQGHKRLAIITGPQGSAVSSERMRGFKEALISCDIQVAPELILEGTSNERFGYDSLVRLINLERPPTGIVTTSTRLTLGVLYAMRDYGIKRPEQMALVGSVGRDLEWMSLFTPPLTYVAQPSREMGREAAKLLIARMSGERNGPGEEFLIKPELIVHYPQPAPDSTD